MRERQRQREESEQRRQNPELQVQQGIDRASSCAHQEAPSGWSGVQMELDRVGP